ncbi:mycofactocin radical SAM maturase [Nocardia fluminea]|uniref:mycofactocin radical SAM maturase n=1 Tax=Nocardia fluminea TaxID=134984 RepID=UPI003819E4DE
MSENILDEIDVARPLVARYHRGFGAPVRLRWELTHAADLPPADSPSRPARRDPRELSSVECLALIDDFERTPVSHVEIGGGEPAVRDDFWDLLDYATGRHLSVEFCTSGTRLTPAAASRIATNGHVNVRISLDGTTEAANDAVRGRGSYRTAVRAMELLASSGVYDFEISVRVTRHNVAQLDGFLAIADLFGAQLRLNLPRPSQRDAAAKGDPHSTPQQQPALYRWLREHAEQVRTGDSFLSLAGDCETLPGSISGDVGQVVCVIDPIGDVYARRLVGYDDSSAGNIRAPGGFERIWRSSDLLTGVPGDQVVVAADRAGAPRSPVDHSHPVHAATTISARTRHKTPRAGFTAPERNV